MSREHVLVIDEINRKDKVKENWNPTNRITPSLLVVGLLVNLREGGSVEKNVRLLLVGDLSTRWRSRLRKDESFARCIDPAASKTCIN